MKKQLLTLVFIVFSSIVFAAGTSAINQFDTVYFDLAHSSVTGNYLQFPVYIKSDDVINSLDFAMQFDLEKLEFDSLIIHNTNMNPLASYNTNDSTLRLTSFSVPAIPNNASLVTLRFKLLNGSDIKKPDFHSLTALLNGDACTAIITEQGIPTSITSVTPACIINVYPNPSYEVLNVEVSQKAGIQLLDISGRQVIAEITAAAGQGQTINTQGLPDGNYFVKINTHSLVTTKKIIIANHH